MKIRTVINELNCRDYALSDEKLLERDVMVSPRDWNRGDGDDMTLRLCEAEDFLSQHRRIDRPGVLLVHTGRSIPASWRETEGDVVAVASPLPFDEFRELFEAIPQKYGRFEIKRELLFEAFQQTYSIQEFTRRAYGILGNPIIVVNIDQRILATAGRFPETREDIEHQISKGYVVESVRDKMDARNVIGRARQARHSFIEKNDVGQRWVTSIVYYKNLELGRFDVLEKENPISYIDLELIDFASSLAGIIIDRSGYTGQNAVSGASVLTDLLSGNFLTEDSARSQIELTRLPLDRTYILMLIEGQQRAFASPTYHSHIGDVARKVFPLGVWVSFREAFVMLMPLRDKASETLPDYQHAELELSTSAGLEEMLERNNLRAFFSEPFEDLLACKMRFTQCRELTDALRGEASSDSRIAYFWRYRFRVLASMASTIDQIDMMLDKRVTAMQRYDRAHQTNYYETALASLAWPTSPTQAAADLSVHRNTYFYRLKQIEQVFHIDLKNSMDRLAVAFTDQVIKSLPKND